MNEMENKAAPAAVAAIDFREVIRTALDEYTIDSGDVYFFEKAVSDVNEAIRAALDTIPLASCEAQRWRLDQVREADNGGEVIKEEVELSWFGATPAAAAPVVLPEPAGYVRVPLEFVRKFNTLAHNYSLTAEAPDHYFGTERDAFSNAYARCGRDLAELRALLATATGLPAQAVPVAVTTPDELAKLSGENVGSNMATVFHPESSGFPVKLYAAPQAQADARDAEIQQAVLTERERICAAIKAEDDHCVTQGDYMLDSDDCIKVARGEWVRPVYDAAIAAAKGE